MYVSGPGTYSLGQKVKRQANSRQWPENLVNPISHNPILVTDVFGFVDVLISFWDQRSKIKVTAGNSPKNRVNAISL